MCVTLEDVYILVAPLDTWSMDDMERQRRARYQKFRGKPKTRMNEKKYLMAASFFLLLEQLQMHAMNAKNFKTFIGRGIFYP